MKTAPVWEAGGFIGSHLVKHLKREGFWVRGIDLNYPEFSETEADDFVIADLREAENCRALIDRRFDEVYQLAADIFTGEHDAAIMHNSAAINPNILETCKNQNIRRIFYSSSACMYLEYNQTDPSAPISREDSACPAAPDSEYGWEKLFSERLYLAYNRNGGMQTRAARYHNIFGPEGTWGGGKEKALAAIARKVAEASFDGSIEIWGDGEQTRSFLYIDECIEGTIRVTRSSFEGPVNIGSDEMVSINKLASAIMEVANKSLRINHIPGPLGVRGRNSHNELIYKRLGWRPRLPLKTGLAHLYPWIEEQVTKARRTNTVSLERMAA
jgi:nucleoside-diphosphate-sugar epimerase